MRHLIVCTAAGALLAGCSTLPDRRPQTPELPAAWGALPPAPETSLVNWWTEFDDPTLDALVADSLAAGPNIRLAALRVLEARATGRNTLARYLPELSASAQLQYNERVEGPPLVGGTNGLFTGQDGAVTFEDRQAISTVGPAISWEVPLFQRLQAAAFGARANNRAALEDLRATQVALAADVADAYVSLRAAQNRAIALEESVALADQVADVLELSAQAGLAARADAADARRLAESTRALLPDARVEIRRSLNVLSALRGQAPETESGEIGDALRAARDIPNIPLRGAPLAPAELLRARPDVRQAEAAALFQAAELGVARADLLPQINITGSFGYSRNVIGASLAEPQSSISATPVISMPLFDWGRRLAQARASDARFEQALEQYRVTVINAVSEASNALTQLAEADERLSAARAAEEAAIVNANGVRASFEAGIAALSDRLRADQQVIDARLNRIEAEATQARAAVLTYRAFAGGPPVETLVEDVRRARVRSPS